MKEALVPSWWVDSCWIHLGTSYWSSGFEGRDIFTLCSYISQTALTGILHLLQKSGWSPIHLTHRYTSLCFMPLKPSSLSAKPKCTSEELGVRVSSVRHPQPWHGCCLKSTDPHQGKVMCTEVGEDVTHSLPAVPKSCLLSAPELFSTARQGYRLA